MIEHPIDSWDFSQIDYTKYNHITNQEKIISFITEHHYSSEFDNLSPNRILYFVTFTSRKLIVDGNEINAILIYCRDAINGIKLCLDIFPNENNCWSTFTTIFDFYTTRDIIGHKAIEEIDKVLNYKCLL